MGGWGVRIEHGSELLEFNGGKQDAGAGEMHLMAVVQALESLLGLQVKKGASVTLFTSSHYVVEGITESLQAWRDSGWKYPDGSSLEHPLLWQALDQLVTAFNLSFVIVRGPSANAGCRRSQELASEGSLAVMRIHPDEFEEHEGVDDNSHSIDQVLAVVSDEEIPLMAMKIWANYLETGNVNISADEARAMNADIGNSEVREGERVAVHPLSPEKAAFVSRIRNLAFLHELAMKKRA